MTATSDQTAALSEELNELTCGEVKHVFVSSSTNRPGSERWTVTAFGETFPALTTTEAYGLLVNWRGSLIAHGARPVTAQELPTAYRAVVERDANGVWRITTQKLDGAPLGDAWSTSVHSDIATAAMLAVDAVLDKHGCTRLWDWVPAEDRTVDRNRRLRYVTIITKG